MHRLELTFTHLVLEVVKCLWLGLDELSPEQRHRSRFTLQSLRRADARDRAAVIPALVDAGEQLALMHKALAATGCDRSARKVRAVLQSLTERLEQEREKVITFSRRLSPPFNARCSAERRSGSALVVRLALVVCYAPVALGSSASEENAPASGWVLFWTSWGHLSAAFVEVIRGRLPLHRADRQLRMQCQNFGRYDED